MQLSGTVLFGLEVLSINCVSFFFRLAKSVNLLEWALSTQFSATDEFIKKWADAQKYVYGMGAGWIVSYHFNITLNQKQTNDLIL